MSTKNLDALFNLFDTEQSSRIESYLKNFSDSFIKSAKQINDTAKEFGKTSAGVSSESASDQQHNETAQAKYLKAESTYQMVSSFTSALSQTVAQLGALAIRAQEFNVALTNVSYRMTNPGAQMDRMYSQGGMLDIVGKLNAEQNTPWQGIQLEEAISGYDTFLKYGKMRNVTEGAEGEKNFTQSLRTGKYGSRIRGMDFDSAMESNMKFNVAGVELNQMMEFNKQLGTMAKLGAMSSKEILGIDSSIRRMAYTFQMTGREIQRFGVDYMEVSAKLSLAGGNPLDLMAKMTQYTTGSESGMMNALILGYDAKDPKKNLELTKQKAHEVQQQLSTVPEVMRAWMFEQGGLGAAQGLGGYKLADLTQLERTGEVTGKIDPNKMLENIEKNTGAAVSSADKFGGALSRMNMTQIRVGKTILEGFTKLFDRYGNTVLSAFEGMAGHLAKSVFYIGGLLTAVNLFKSGFLIYAASRLGSSTAGNALKAITLGGSAIAAGTGAAIGAAGTFVAGMGVEAWKRWGTHGTNAQQAQHLKDRETLTQKLNEALLMPEGPEKETRINNIQRAIATTHDEKDNYKENYLLAGVKTWDPRGVLKVMKGEKDYFSDMPQVFPSGPTTTGMYRSSGDTDMSGLYKQMDESPESYNANRAMRDKLKAMAMQYGLTQSPGQLSSESLQRAHKAGSAHGEFRGFDMGGDPAKVRKWIEDFRASGGKAFWEFGGKETLQDVPEALRDVAHYNPDKHYTGQHLHNEFAEGFELKGVDVERQNMIAAAHQEGKDATAKINASVAQGTPLSQTRFGMTATRGTDIKGVQAGTPGAVTDPSNAVATQTAAQTATGQVTETVQDIAVHDARVKEAIDRLADAIFGNKTGVMAFAPGPGKVAYQSAQRGSGQKLASSHGG